MRRIICRVFSRNERVTPPSPMLSCMARELRQEVRRVFFGGGPRDGHDVHQSGSARERAGSDEVGEIHVLDPAKLGLGEVVERAVPRPAVGIEEDRADAGGFQVHVDDQDIAAFAGLLRGDDGESGRPSNSSLQAAEHELPCRRRRRGSGPRTQSAPTILRSRYWIVRSPTWTGQAAVSARMRAAPGSCGKQAHDPRARRGRARCEITSETRAMRSAARSFAGEERQSSGGFPQRDTALHGGCAELSLDLSDEDREAIVEADHRCAAFHPASMACRSASACCFQRAT